MIHFWTQWYTTICWTITTHTNNTYLQPKVRNICQEEVQHITVCVRVFTEFKMSKWGIELRFYVKIFQSYLNVLILSVVTQMRKNVNVQTTHEGLLQDAVEHIGRKNEVRNLMKSSAVLKQNIFQNLPTISYIYVYIYLNEHNHLLFEM